MGNMQRFFNFALKTQSDETKPERGRHRGRLASGFLGAGEVADMYA